MSCSHDKVKLDIFWLKNDTLEDSADLPDPDVLVKIMRKKCKADSPPLQLWPIRCSYYDGAKAVQRAGAGQG